MWVPGIELSSTDLAASVFSHCAIWAVLKMSLLRWRNGLALKSTYALVEAQGSIPSTTWPSKIPVLEDLMPSSDLLGQQEHAWCTHVHAGKTFLHKTIYISATQNFNLLLLFTYICVSMGVQQVTFWTSSLDHRQAKLPSTPYI